MQRPWMTGNPPALFGDASPTVISVRTNPKAELACSAELDTLQLSRSLPPREGGTLPSEKSAMKVIGDRFKSLPVTGVVLGMVALGILGVAYWSSVQESERSISGAGYFRPPRESIEPGLNLIENRAPSSLTRSATRRLPQPDRAMSLRSATARMRAAGAKRPGARAHCLAEGLTQPANRTELKDHRWTVGSERSSLQIKGSSSWRADGIDNAAPGQRGTGWRLPGPARYKSIIDTLVLATPNRRLSGVAGRRASGMQAMSVSAVLRCRPGRNART